MLISKFAGENMDDRIAGFEKRYNIALPDLYKKFLSKYNGGYTPKTKFKIGKVSSDIRGFYGVGDIKLGYDSIEIRKWIKENVLPIAMDSFGNYLAIGLDNEEKGKIFFCDHEEGNKKRCIAKDLKEFFGECKSEKISETSRISIKEREQALIARGRGSMITDDLRKMWQAEIDKYQNMVQEEVVFDDI